MQAPKFLPDVQPWGLPIALPCGNPNGWNWRSSSVVSLKAPERANAACPRVEILGLFGSGKTTLAKRLTRRGCTHLAEDHALNPFWGDDRILSISGQLPYDLSFLLQHWHAAARRPLDAESVGICDWSFVTDRLWASMRDEGDMDVYDAAHRRCLKRMGDPIGYLYLRHSIDVVASRLAKRGREVEAPLLQTLSEAFAQLERIADSFRPSSVIVCDDFFSADDLDRAIEGWRG